MNTHFISVLQDISLFRTEDVETDLKNELISKNSVAILMPYLRSEILY